MDRSGDAGLERNEGPDVRQAIVTYMGARCRPPPKRQRIRGGILRTYPLAPTEQAVLFGAGRR